MSSLLRSPDALTEISDSHIVRCEALSKRYGDFVSLRDCSLEVARGEVFGLLGPNGAGKTTLIRLMLGYLRPSSGRSLINGFDPQVDAIAVKRQVSYLPGDARLPRHMRGRGVLRFFSELHPDGDLDRSLHVADALELDLSRRVAFMSTGMRQKLALAVVFGPHTPLCILDEPTANLDPSVRATVLKLVEEARDEGRTVVFSSHVLSEIEQTCDRVVFLRHGELVHRLWMRDLFQRHRIHGVQPTDAAELVIEPDLEDHLVIRSFEDGRVQIDTDDDLAPILPWLVRQPLERIRIEPLGLQTIYHQVHLGDDSDALVPNGGTA
ncbi:MAG: ABC transporter ATP-binding protein [Planctomycetota bacterium]